MKRGFILLVCVWMLSGCSGTSEDMVTAPEKGILKIKNYITHPVSFIKDPHFSEYKKQRDALESSYLKKEMTYAEHVEQKNDLDEKYNKEVIEREEKIRE